MSDFEQNEQWAVILGGSAGIGLASAQKLAAHGLNLIILHKDRRSELEKASSAFDEIRNSGVKLLTFNKDAVSPESIKELSLEIQDYLLKENGKVKLLLHSIARGNLKSLFDLETLENSNSDDDSLIIKDFFALKSSSTSTGKLNLQDFDLTIHSMALSLLSWTNRLLDFNLFSQNARIIGLTSEGDKKVWGSYAAVASAKATLESLVKYMAIELASKKITANLIQAGVTDTQSLQMIPGSDFLKSFSKERNPNKRLTTPEDIANVVYLLCKDEASWINGTTIVADGGEHLV